MSHPQPPNRFTPAEEIAHAVTHGIGVALAVAGLAVLVALAAVRGTAWHVVGCSVFGATMVLLYLASTLYHAIPAPRAKAILQVLDHAAIYLLIAGTYTPFTLVNMRGPWGWTLFGIVWGLALVGIVLEATLRNRAKRARLGLYLCMGWAGLVALKPLMASLEPAGQALVWAGGIAYTLGVAFYVARRLRFGHAIWHGFVLAGTTLHFFAVLFHVVPVAR